MKQQPLVQSLFTASAVIILLGAVLHILLMPFAPYIFTIGAILLVVVHGIIAFLVKGDFHKRRVTRIGFIASLFLLLSSYLMFADSNSWVVFLLIYAAISFYLSFRAA